LSCRLIAFHALGGSTYTLIEADGFVPLADPRIAQLRERLGGDLYRLLAVGSYAVPLPEAAGSTPEHAPAVYSARG